MMRNTDCLIIGGGLAGWMAARETVSMGLRPMLVHDGMGASPWVHGFNAPVCAGDSAEEFLRDTLRSGQGLSDPLLAAALCRDAAKAFTQVQNLDLSFNMEGDQVQALRPLGASYPRVVSIGNETGLAILAKLRQALADQLDEIPAARAVRLLTAEGRVCGVLIWDKACEQWVTIAAKTVVLACGGFCGIYPRSTNKRDSGGDGVAMAYEAGAELCDMEMIQFEPSGAVWPPALVGTSMITTLLFEGAVLRNRCGERFMQRYSSDGEHAGKDVLCRCIALEIEAGRCTDHGGVYFDATGVGSERLERDYALYVKRYRDVGIDLCTQPIEIAPVPHTALGGVRIDADGCTTVEGLFACGEVTGGLHGANRIGGSAGLETLVFGRRAGRAAAKYALASAPVSVMKELPVCAGASIAKRLDALREDMQSALWNGLNATRSQQSLCTCISVLQASLHELETYKGCNPSEAYHRLRMQNDLTAALLAAQAALAREGSLGCHVRTDAPERHDPLYRVVERRLSNHQMEIRKECIQG